MTMDLDLLIPGGAKNTLAMSSDEIFARKGSKELQVLYEKRDELTKKIETIEKQINNERVVVSFHSDWDFIGVKSLPTWSTRSTSDKESRVLFSKQPWIPSLLYVDLEYRQHAQKFYKLLGSRSTSAYISVDIDFIYLFKPPSSQSLSDPGPDITTVDGVNFVEHVIQPLWDEFGLMDDAIQSICHHAGIAIGCGHLFHGAEAGLTWDDETVLMWLGTLSRSLPLEKVVYIDHGDKGG